MIQDLLQESYNAMRHNRRRTALTMPALTVTVAEMAAALTRVAGPQVSALIDWVPDPVISRMFATWPARIQADRAARLGLTPDPDFDSVIRMHLAERPSPIDLMGE